MSSFSFGHASLAIGGIALFLFGVRLASDGLKGLAGGRLRIVLSAITGRRIPAMLAGAAATLMLQSTAATTVMLVGLCNVGLLGLHQAAGMVLGSFIGSTLIVQLIAFDVAQYALLGVAAGLLLAGMRHRIARNAGGVVLGFGLIFYGLHLIRLGFEPIHTTAEFGAFFSRLGASPLGFVEGILAAALLTAVTQSSVVTVAVAFALVRGGAMPALGALSFVFGAHLASDVTPLIAAAGSPRRGKRVLLFDFATRLAGLLIFAPFSVYIVRLAQHLAGPVDDPARAVAWQHTIVNVANPLFMLPFSGMMIRAARRLLPTRAALPAGVILYIDPKFADPPPIALEKARKEIHAMGLRVTADLTKALAAIEDNDAAALQAIAAADDATDLAHKVVTEYLSRLQVEQASLEARRRNALLYVSNNIEQIGDVVSGMLVDMGLKKEERGGEFSIEGARLLRVYHRRVVENLRAALELILAPDETGAREIIENEGRLNIHRRAVYEAHMEQFGRGVKEARETSAVYTDILAALQQITRHSSEIAEMVV